MDLQWPTNSLQQVNRDQPTVKVLVHLHPRPTVYTCSVRVATLNAPLAVLDRAGQDEEMPNLGTNPKASCDDADADLYEAPASFAYDAGFCRCLQSMD